MTTAVKIERQSIFVSELDWFVTNYTKEQLLSLQKLYAYWFRVSFNDQIGGFNRKINNRFQNCNYVYCFKVYRILNSILQSDYSYDACVRNSKLNKI